MKKRLLGLALLAGTLSMSRNASADTPIDAQAVDDALTYFGFGVVDFGLTAIDLSFSIRDTWAPRPYAGVEIFAGGAELAVCLDKALSPPPTTYRGALAGPTPWAFEAAFGAAFLAHGIVTMVRPGSHTEAPPERGPVTIAPLALSDAARTSVPGLAVIGRF